MFPSKTSGNSSKGAVFRRKIPRVSSKTISPYKENVVTLQRQNNKDGFGTDLYNQ